MPLLLAVVPDNNADAEVAPGSSTTAPVARHEQAALALAALAAVGTILWLISPVGAGILLGVLLAFTFLPTYERIARRRPPLAAALATVLGSNVAMVLTVGGLLWILVSGGTVLGRTVLAALGPGGGAKKILLSLDDVASRLGISTDEVHTKVQSLVVGAVVHAEGLAQTLVSTMGSTVLALLFEMLTMYFILRRWEAIVAAIQNALPLRPEHTRKLLEEFRRVGRTTLMSTVVMGLLQGVLATIGYAIVGLPQPLFFGALTAVASLVPGLGTMLVWVPASVALVLFGRVGSGILLACWGAVFMSAIPTYVIHPRLVGRGSEVPALFTFIALFGGTAVLGLKGLVVGPVLMTMAIAILRIYAEEQRARRNAVPIGTS